MPGRVTFLAGFHKSGAKRLFQGGEISTIFPVSFPGSPNAEQQEPTPRARGAQGIQVEREKQLAGGGCPTHLQPLPQVRCSHRKEGSL